VINAVLDLSKIESGHFELSQAAVDLHELVDDVQSMLRDAVRAKGLQLTAEIDRPPAPLQGDGTRLQQALLNLAVNAVRFTDRGTVALRERVEADAGSRCRLRFEVQDTGSASMPRRSARSVPSNRPTTRPRATRRHRAGPDHHATGAADGQ
jgi:signal transduction histidine kinase